MKKQKAIVICNFVILVLATIYSFVPYTSMRVTRDIKFELQCDNAWFSGSNDFVQCMSGGRLAQIIFWAGLASALVTTFIILENYRKPKIT